MGLPRPSEPFHRVYSPPEPPSTATRRSAVVGIFTVVAAFAVAASVVLVLLSGRGSGDRSGHGTGDGATGAARSSARIAPPRSVPPSPPAGTLTVLPAPCGMVARPTVERLVPRARSEQSANSTLGTCTYASARAGSRWLRVETRLFDPVDGTDPVAAASGFFAAQWTRARNDPVVRTVSLERQGGLGDEAYRWYKIDKGQPTVVGEVAVRFRNAVMTVSYSGEAPGADDSPVNERMYLTEATGVVREGLDALE
ncbi:hypothetical protein [Actinomadura sp. HBU206391]|uniref:hypothetical protein n=1 Tax=Actinomadura sp. HBU206391 TaxID=2731692 RepID=UPI00164FF38D|nr:hypothetical protein [Actinomadura sp. HBU206391]MBC6460417.1 hypothetical protein [Actinomadura sp. HBU206391]